MNRKWRSSDCYLTCANILGCVAIVILAAAIGTDRWLVFTVDRKSLSSETRNSSNSGTAALYHHTRQRGMWRECYPGTDTMFLDTAKDVVDKNCFMLKLIDNVDGASEKYKMKIALHTSFVAMFIIAEALLVVAYILGLLLCVGKCSKNAWLAALLSFFGAFLFSLGMALFHGSFYVEQEQIIDVPTDRPEYRLKWSTALRAATTVDYSESYIVAWVGIVLVLITCICYIFAARSLRKPKRAAKQHPSFDNYAFNYPQTHVYPSDQQTSGGMVYYVA